MTHDVIVIGGSYAGMAAALQLLRARRSVLVIDAGQRRNRTAEASHGFLGQDGVDPGRIAAEARAQLERYQTLTWIEGEAVAAGGSRDSFEVLTSDGTRHAGRRLLFATGVRDALPPVEGLAERWGRHAFHCPYCHGYELEMGRIGVIATGPSSLHQALMLPEWGQVTLLVNDALTLDDEARAELDARGIAIEETPIARLSGEATAELTDGRSLTFAGLFVASTTSPATPLAQEMGCALQETPMGMQLQTDDLKETSIPGAYACGDTARMPHSVSLAVADGAWAGATIHRSLIFPAA
ncbi:Thioredoxin reductase [Pseudooceanicola antarcticus]|uniref:Thioredoxin reductase n=1 Tax=Pseudooceanicola antarcticus TaxID=1247613 RepID=A0A285HPK4_9RHOB|nr:NAD(P)/FAD-dependent oxidoreductase [Pseudooceanicola antarcticus]PJE27700.1 NAD(P)/FAD-dependent oxidoreductase [Pseudooceanicola antarcticus]SNY37669.1 Thioredoxin reductase [Pseudooceanicola antarcticus]